MALRPGFIYGTRAVGSGANVHLGWVGLPLKAVSAAGAVAEGG